MNCLVTELCLGSAWMFFFAPFPFIDSSSKGSPWCHPWNYKCYKSQHDLEGALPWRQLHTFVSGWTPTWKRRDTGKKNALSPILNTFDVPNQRDGWISFCFCSFFKLGCHTCIILAFRDAAIVFVFSSPSWLRSTMFLSTWVQATSSVIWSQTQSTRLVCAVQMPTTSGNGVTGLKRSSAHPRLVCGAP